MFKLTLKILPPLIACGCLAISSLADGSGEYTANRMPGTNTLWTAQRTQAELAAITATNTADLTAETTLRIAGTNAIWNALADQLVDRIAGTNTLWAAIATNTANQSAETSLRITGTNALWTALASESSLRIAGTNTLWTALASQLVDGIDGTNALWAAIATNTAGLASESALRIAGTNAISASITTSVAVASSAHVVATNAQGVAELASTRATTAYSLASAVNTLATSAFVAASNALSDASAALALTGTLTDPYTLISRPQEGEAGLTSAYIDLAATDANDPSCRVFRVYAPTQMLWTVVEPTVTNFLGNTFAWDGLGTSVLSEATLPWPLPFPPSGGSTSFSYYAESGVSTLTASDSDGSVDFFLFTSRYATNAIAYAQFTAAQYSDAVSLALAPVAPYSGSNVTLSAAIPVATTNYVATFATREALAEFSTTVTEGLIYAQLLASAAVPTNSPQWQAVLTNTFFTAEGTAASNLVAATAHIVDTNLHLLAGDRAKIDGALQTETDLAALRAHHYGSPDIVESPAEWFVFNGSGIITAFNWEAGRTNVVIPWAIGGVPVTTIGANAFQLSGIASAIAPQTVTVIVDGAFSFCPFLTSVTIPQVTSIGGSAFPGCSSLTSINLPQATSIGFRAFYSCESLTAVHMGQNAPAEATDVFAGITTPPTVYVTNPNATGWGAEWNDAPVVRPPLYADAIYQAGELVATTGHVAQAIAAIPEPDLSGKLDASGGTASNLTVTGFIALPQTAATNLVLRMWASNDVIYASEVYQ